MEISYQHFSGNDNRHVIYNRTALKQHRILVHSQHLNKQQIKAQRKRLLTISSLKIPTLAAFLIIKEVTPLPSQLSEEI